MTFLILLFRNNFLLQNPSNINLPPSKSHISLHSFLSLVTPHGNIFEVTSSPSHADLLHCISLCSKQLWWRPQAVSSWALSHFHFPPICVLLSQTLKGPRRLLRRLEVTFWVWSLWLFKKKPSKVAELVNCISNTAVMSLLCAYLCTFGSLSKKQVIAL